MVTLPAGYLTRPMRLEDAPALVEMFNAYFQAVVGIDMDTLDDDIAWWNSSFLSLERDTCVVFAPGGKPVGHIEFIDMSESHVHLFTWGCVHPGYWGKGVGSYLLEWADQRSQRNLVKAPEGARVILSHSVLDKDDAAVKLLIKQGYQYARSSWTMQIDLLQEPAPPKIPDHMIIRPMVPGDDNRAIVSVVNESFRDHWGYVEESFELMYARWEKDSFQNPVNDLSVWFVAEENGEIGGVCLCKPRTAETEDYGFVMTLGVIRTWRKRGVGTALLQTAFLEMYRRGKKAVQLSVDSENLTGAVKLYKRAGMYVLRERKSFEKELRSGKELGTVAL
jgi:mycothiol synthase